MNLPWPLMLPMVVGLDMGERSPEAWSHTPGPHTLDPNPSQPFQSGCCAFFSLGASEYADQDSSPGTSSRLSPGPFPQLCLHPAAVLTALSPRGRSPALLRENGGGAATASCPHHTHREDSQALEVLLKGRAAGRPARGRVGRDCLGRDQVGLAGRAGLMVTWGAWVEGLGVPGAGPAWFRQPTRCSGDAPQPCGQHPAFLPGRHRARLVALRLHGLSVGMEPGLRRPADGGQLG